MGNTASTQNQPISVDRLKNAVFGLVLLRYIPDFDPNLPFEDVEKCLHSYCLPALSSVDDKELFDAYFNYYGSLGALNTQSSMDAAIERYVENHLVNDKKAYGEFFHLLMNNFYPELMDDSEECKLKLENCALSVVDTDNNESLIFPSEKPVKQRLRSEDNHRNIKTFEELQSVNSNKQNDKGNDNDKDKDKDKESNSSKHSLKSKLETLKKKNALKRIEREEKERLRELRERELNEIQEREREKEKREQELREQEQREQEQREQEQREQEQREQELREQEQREQEQREQEQREQEQREQEQREQEQREQEQREQEQREQELREQEQREQEQREKEQREQEQREQEQREQEQREQEQREQEQREQKQRERLENQRLREKSDENDERHVENDENHVDSISIKELESLRRTNGKSNRVNNNVLRTKRQGVSENLSEPLFTKNNRKNRVKVNSPRDYAEELLSLDSEFPPSEVQDSHNIYDYNDEELYSENV